MNPQIQTIAISEFKTHALKILKKVGDDQQIIIITKRGKPLAQITPYREPAATPEPGQLAHTFLHEDDIVAPLDGDLWEACR